MDEPRYWLALSMVQGIGPVKTRALIEHFGTLQLAWQAAPSELQQAGLDKRALKNLLEAREQIDLEREWTRLQRSQSQILTWNDSAYPARLKEIDDAPPALYIRGELSSADEFAVAIVGTRLASAYGKEVARSLAENPAFVAALKEALAAQNQTVKPTEAVVEVVSTTRPAATEKPAEAANAGKSKA